MKKEWSENEKELLKIKSMMTKIQYKERNHQRNNPETKTKISTKKSEALLRISNIQLIGLPGGKKQKKLIRDTVLKKS